MMLHLEMKRRRRGYCRKSGPFFNFNFLPAMKFRGRVVENSRESILPIQPRSKPTPVGARLGRLGESHH